MSEKTARRMRKISDEETIAMLRKKLNEANVELSRRLKYVNNISEGIKRLSRKIRIWREYIKDHQFDVDQFPVLEAKAMVKICEEDLGLIVDDIPGSPRFEDILKKAV